MTNPARVRTATVKKLLAILKEAGVARFRSPEIEVEFAPPGQPTVLAAADPRLQLLQDLMPGYDGEA